MNIHKLVPVIIGVGFFGASVDITYAACEEGEPTTLICSALEIEESVSTKAAYPATLKCEGLKSFKIYSGEFYWNGEGPYKIKKKKVKKKSDEVVFKLRTRNAGRYKIEGFLNYKNCNKEVLKTDRLSAGYVTAK